MGEGFNHHRRADFAGTDALGGGGEIGIEPAHETKLQLNAGKLDGVDDGIAFGQRKRHGLLEEYVQPRLCGFNCKISMREGRRGDHNGIEVGLFESLVEGFEAGIDVIFFRK